MILNCQFVQDNSEGNTILVAVTAYQQENQNPIVTDRRGNIYRLHDDSPYVDERGKHWIFSSVDIESGSNIVTATFDGPVKGGWEYRMHCYESHPVYVASNYIVENAWVQRALTELFLH